jgi:hypothetical protein
MTTGHPIPQIGDIVLVRGVYADKALYAPAIVTVVQNNTVVNLRAFLDQGPQSVPDPQRPLRPEWHTFVPREDTVATDHVGPVWCWKPNI